MARKIQYTFVLILLLVVPGMVAAQTPPCSPEDGVSIVLDSGAALSPGSYRIVVELDGEQVTAVANISCSSEVPIEADASNATVGTQPNAPADEVEAANRPGEAEEAGASPQDSNNPPQVESTTNSGILNIVIAALVPIILIAAGAAVYFKIIRPRKQLEPYRNALRHLQEQDYESALPLLTSIESKLEDKQRQEARFFIAFANFQLKNITDAKHQLKALYGEKPQNTAVAYLLAYLLVQDKQYDEAEPILERMEVHKQLSFHYTRQLLGIVKLQRGLTALQEGRLDAAGTLFEKVQSLGDFAEQIPTDLRNRHVVLGTKALFEKDLPAARQQFQSLEKAKADLPAEQHDTLLATVKLGLALAHWIEEKADSLPEIEQLLVEAAHLLAPDQPTEGEWPESMGGKDIVQQLAELDEKEQVPDEEDRSRCLRDLHFLRGMVVLRAWSLMDGEKAYQEKETYLQNTLTRFAASLNQDENFSDVMLVVGLLKYYLHKAGSSERKEGVANLQAAQKQGMRNPDVMEIINNQIRVDSLNADAVDKYLQVLDRYLTDDTVRREVRLTLMERLAKYRKIQSWKKRPDLAQARTIEPTVAEMRERSEILQEKIAQILKTQRASEALGDVEKLSQELTREGQQLSEQAKTVSEKEAELLAVTGNQLFQDE